MKRFRYLHLYAEPSSSSLDLDVVADYVRKEMMTRGCEVDVRKEFFTFFLARNEVDATAGKIAAAKVFNTRKPFVRHELSPSEVELEKALLLNPGRRHLQNIYDGFEVQQVCGALIPEEESDLEHVHVVLTGRLLGTYSDNDYRYHYRTIICGYPTVICTSGIVEAPAKPREFYLLYNYYASMGTANMDDIKKKFEGRFIDYDDPRLTEVVKGFVLQGLFYRLVGDPFCDRKECRLLNAHWQEDMIQSQLKYGRLCEYHSNLIRQPGW